MCTRSWTSIRKTGFTSLSISPKNIGSHYWQLFDIADGKTLFLLTATPVNNRLIDLQHMIELFSRREPAYFSRAPLGIHSLAGHFRKIEKELEELIQQRSGSTQSDDIV